jgi:hypothetical protein
MSLAYGNNHKKVEKQSRMLYDIIVKKHDSNMIVLRYVIDEHIFTIIENLIKSYQVRQWTEE